MALGYRALWQSGPAVNLPRMWLNRAATSRRGMASKFESFFQEEPEPTDTKASSSTPELSATEALRQTKRTPPGSLPGGVLPISQDIELPEAPTKFNTNADVAKHPEVYAMMHPRGHTAAESMLSPLKRALYTKAVAASGGFYVDNLEIEHEGAVYKLKLTVAEQRALEPSVYAKSWRIKWSWKKMFVFLRPFRRMNAEDAISQMHFSHKGRARDVAEMLERALEQGKQLGLDPSRLVIDQIWVGKDGEDRKRIDIKGRGRSGMIVHPYVHVKAILKDVSAIEQLQKRRTERLLQRATKPARNYRLQEGKTQISNYRW